MGPILRFVLAVIGAVVVCAIVTAINRTYLPYMVGLPGMPADDYEVFVYSIIRIGPIIFVTTAFTLYHVLNHEAQRSRFRRCAIVIGVLSVLLSLAADVWFMPAVRFH